VIFLIEKSALEKKNTSHNCVKFVRHVHFDGHKQYMDIYVTTI